MKSLNYHYHCQRFAWLPMPEGSDTKPSCDNSYGSGGAPKVIDFSRLAGDLEEVWIELNGITYRLRQTRQGKLILTK